MNDPVKTHICDLLGTDEAHNKTVIAKIRQVEAAGHRIVDGGQTGDYDDHHRCTWEITDWRTGERLAAGHTTIEDYYDTWSTAGAEQRWRHIDTIEDAVPDPVEPPLPKGLPASLAEALREWLDSAGTTDEEVAGFIGWPLEYVARCRANPRCHPDMIGETTP